MIDIQSLHDYDKLTDDIKKLFRDNNIEFFSPVWFQCKCLTDSDQEAFRMFKRIHNSL